MRTSERTLLASLGFVDADKKEPEHDLACRYLIQPDMIERIVMEVFEGCFPRSWGHRPPQPERTMGEGEENVILAPVENAVTVAMARGFTPTGDVCRTPYAREELVGQPLFADLVGPMGHGDGIVRYETVEMYALLSQ